MKNYIIVTLLVILAFSGCKNNSSTNDIQDTPTTKVLVEPISHPEFTGIKPKEWKEMVIPQVPLYKYFPDGVNSTEKHPENIMIMVANATEVQGKSISQLIDDSVKSMQKTITDLKVIDKPKTVNIGPLDGMQVITQGTVDGDKMQSAQIFAKNNKKIYIMTYSCKVGSCKNYHILELMAKNLNPL
jgi:hypothetical protein